jgi:hypothetical protein
MVSSAAWEGCLLWSEAWRGWRRADPLEQIGVVLNEVILLTIKFRRVLSDARSQMMRVTQ